MVVARPFEPSSADSEAYQCTAPIVPTKILTDPEELNRQLLQNGYATAFIKYTEENCIEVEAINFTEEVESEAIPSGASVIQNAPVVVTPVETECSTASDSETEKFAVTLNKNDQGLGNA